ncbi:MAG: PD-(D/E)XK nuclease family protein [Candidatus Micrarchaeia archaeon]
MVEYIDFDKLIDRYLHREVKQRIENRYFPSEIGQCLRKSWFNIKIPKPVEPEVTKVFEAGNLFHAFIVEVLKSEKNPEVKLIESELPLKYKIDEFEVIGRIDDLIQLEHNGEKVLVEVKSTKSLDTLKEPSESYVMQLQFYMHVTGVKNGAILYIEKNTLKSKAFFLEYDPTIAEKIIARFKRLHHSVKNNEIPEPEAKLDLKKRWMCNFCPYRQECDGIEKGEQ